MEEIIFSRGDILYYPHNVATAVLLEYDWVEESWTYSLRSPLESDRHGNHYVMLDCTKESMLQGAVEQGRFVHYPVRERAK